MTKDEAIEALRNIFHKARLTKDVSVPPEIIAAILYDQIEKKIEPGHRSWYRSEL